MVWPRCARFMGNTDKIGFGCASLGVRVGTLDFARSLTPELTRVRLQSDVKSQAFSQILDRSLNGP
jgi:hypothetical protein